MRFISMPPLGWICLADLGTPAAPAGTRSRLALRRRARALGNCAMPSAPPGENAFGQRQIRRLVDVDRGLGVGQRRPRRSARR